MKLSVKNRWHLQKDWCWCRSNNKQ